MGYCKKENLDSPNVFISEVVFALSCMIMNLTSQVQTYITFLDKTAPL